MLDNFEHRQYETDSPVESEHDEEYVADSRRELINEAANAPMEFILTKSKIAKESNKQVT